MEAIKIETHDNVINYELKENEKFKNVEIFGEVDTVTDKEKISWIKSLFKRGTIKGSCIKNELYIIDDKYGFYSNAWGYQFCEYTETEEIVQNFYDTKKITVYDTKHLKKLDINDIYNLLDDDTKEKANKLIEDKQNEFYKYSSNRFYYEFEVASDLAKMYLEYKNSCFSIGIDKDKNLKVYLDGYELNVDDYRSVKDVIDKKIDEEVIKYIDKGITKLDNGFIYKNRYYEDFDEIKDLFKADLVEKVGDKK